MRTVQILVLVVLSACSYERYHQVSEGPLPAREFGPSITDNANPLSDLGENGLRFFAEPSFGAFSYQFDFVPKPDRCVLDTFWERNSFWAEIKGQKFDPKTACQHFIVNTFREKKSENRDTSIEREAFTFVVPKHEMDHILTKLEYRIGRWKGSSELWFDGTSMSFEFVRDGRVRSMSSDVDLPDSPVAELSEEIHRLAVAYGPSEMVSKTSNWTSRGRERNVPCSGEELNIADPDGYGFGDDDCAKYLKGQKEVSD